MADASTYSDIHSLLGMATSGEKHFDLLMKVSGVTVPVDSKRPEPDFGEIEGYWWGGHHVAASGELAAVGHRVAQTLYIVRHSGVGTHALFQAMATKKTDVSVVIKVFKAGGSAERVLEISGEKCEVRNFQITTGGPKGAPCDIVGFAPRKIKIVVAGQQSTGSKGGDAEFEWDLNK